MPIPKPGASKGAGRLISHFSHDPSILKFIFICLEVLAIFNLLIIVHEVGHFLAARWRGLIVEGLASGLEKHSGRKKSMASPTASAAFRWRFC